MISNIPNINPRRQLFTILIREFREESHDKQYSNINPRRQLFTILIRGFREESHDKQYSKYQSQETALYNPDQRISRRIS
jgi:hypothetical protein